MTANPPEDNTGFDRTPPSDHNAEQAVLGGMLLSPQAITDATTILQPADFYRPHHTTIYTTILRLHENGHPADPVTVANHLANTGALARIGGATYLHTLIASVPTTANTTYYATIVKAKATQRRLIETGTRLTQLAYTYTETDTTRLTQLHTEFGQLLDGTYNLNGNGAVAHLIGADTIRMLPTDWLWLNRIPIGEITVVSGREGVGKSVYFAWLAAAVTLGNLDGIYEQTPKTVLVSAVEDSWEKTIAPRLYVAGADMRRVKWIRARHPDGELTTLLLPHDLQLVADAAAQTDAALLLCDPLLANFDPAKVNTFKAIEVRHALTPLKQTAEAANIAVAGLVHYNKTSHKDVGSMVAGARAFVEVARSHIAIAVDPDADDYTCVLSVPKANLASTDQPSLTYTIRDTIIDADHPANASGRDIHAGRLVWTGESDVSAEELLTDTAGPRQLGETAQSVYDWVVRQSGPFAVADAASYFENVINPGNLKKILFRLAKSGRILSPSRGLYAPPDPTKSRRTRH